MVRINSNISAANAAFQLGRNHRDLARLLERLSSGLKINRGADNPAGLIVSERLRSEISAMKQAVNNSQRAINVIATTEGALNEASTLLNDIQGLPVEAANSGAFSDEEIDANQLQITTENLMSSESVIRDTDFAEETSELTRAQILVQAGTSILTTASANQQNVLSLLGG